MNTSDSIKELATALAKAQGAMAGAKKDVSNPFFKSKYADLASVWEACRTALTDNGIAVVQMTMPSERDEVVVVTRLCHNSGEWMQGELRMPVTKADAQGFGSALTYARRYSLAAAVGVAPEDDDGNAAAQAKPEVRPISGHQLNKEEYEALTAEEKDYIRTVESEVLKLFSDKADIATYLEKKDLNDNQKMALWSLLASNVRTEIRRQQANKRKAA